MTNTSKHFCISRVFLLGGLDISAFRSGWNVTLAAGFSYASGNDANSPAFDAKNMKQWGWDGWDWMNLGDYAQKFGEEYIQFKTRVHRWI